jgi:hypothetical protein
MKVNPNHNIYILRSFGRDNKSIIKLGKSADINNRIKSYLSANPYIELIGTWEVADYDKFESYIHRTYKSIYKNEWYSEDLLEELINEIESNKLNGNRIIEIQYEEVKSTKPKYIDYLQLLINVELQATNIQIELLNSKCLEPKYYNNSNVSKIYRKIKSLFTIVN